MAIIQKVKTEWKKSWQLYLLVLPTLIWYGVFIYKPMWGLLISFKEYSVFQGFAGSDWVGLDNFTYLLSNPEFWRAFINTIELSIGGLVFGFPVPIFLAILLWELKHAFSRKVIQTVVYLPHFISVVIVSGLMLTFLAPSVGVINIIIRHYHDFILSIQGHLSWAPWLAHLLDHINLDEQYFMIDPAWFKTIFISSNIWQSSGFSSIVYFAAIVGINPALYEAATLDGASRFQQIRHITLPCILPTIVIMFIIAIGHLMDSNFEKIILLYQPATYSTADTLGSFVYRIGIENTQYGPATAAGLFNALIAVVLVFGSNRIAKKISETSLW